jgi:hypothetical protein
MQAGFLAKSITLDESVLAEIRKVMPCAAAHLLGKLQQADFSKLDPKSIFSPVSYGAAQFAVAHLLREEPTDVVVGCSRAWIRSKFPDLADETHDVIFKLIRFIRQDNCTNAQCKIPTSWLLNGFGFWAKVFPGFQVDILPAVVETLKSAGIDCKVRGPGHLICPPKGGTELKSHIDGSPAPVLLETLMRFLDDGMRTNEQFAAHNGVQMLTHLRGGRDGSGATQTLAPMTPARYALLLRTISTAGGEAGRKFWDDSHGGPKFYCPCYTVIGTYLQTIRAIRAALPNGCDPFLASIIRDDELSVSLNWTSMAPAGDGPFVLAFPRGYLHSKAANTEAGRISLSGGISFASDGCESSIGSATRIRKLAFFEDLSMMATDPAAIARVEAQKDPFSGGATHKGIREAGPLMRKSFAPLCPTPLQSEKLSVMSE